MRNLSRNLLRVTIGIGITMIVGGYFALYLISPTAEFADVSSRVSLGMTLLVSGAAMTFGVLFFKK